jgi:competence protein ComEC
MGLFFVGAIGMVVALRAERKLRRWEWAAPGLLLAVKAVLIASCPFGPSVHPGRLEITVLDVAQGDSILVLSPKGSTLLIDGGGAFEGFCGPEEHLGPDPGEGAVSAYLWSRGFQS